jgi:ADP-ribose pyrophosphatase YjhB (NUDIX family)
MEKINNILIRVYGLIFNEKNEILLSDEYVHNTYMTKFPGGGLIPGEGPEDCLKREAIEELNQEIEIISHFYTTGFFQKALFFENTQLISIYYKARLLKPVGFKISVNSFDFEELRNGNQSFRWASMDKLNSEDLTFPIDKHVINLLKNKNSI